MVKMSASYALLVHIQVMDLLNASIALQVLTLLQILVYVILAQQVHLQQLDLHLAIKNYKTIVY